jgi:hypothetical protein
MWVGASAHHHGAARHAVVDAAVTRQLNEGSMRPCTNGRGRGLIAMVVAMCGGTWGLHAIPYI